MYNNQLKIVNFILSEKATNFCEISTVDLPYVVTVKSTVEINFVAFLEYINFKNLMRHLILTAHPWPNFLWNGRPAKISNWFEGVWGTFLINSTQFGIVQNLQRQGKTICKPKLEKNP